MYKNSILQYLIDINGIKINKLSKNLNISTYMLYYMINNKIIFEEYYDRISQYFDIDKEYLKIKNYKMNQFILMKNEKIGKIVSCEYQKRKVFSNYESNKRSSEQSNNENLTNKDSNKEIKNNILNFIKNDVNLIDIELKKVDKI